MNPAMNPQTENRSIHRFHIKHQKRSNNNNNNNNNNYNYNNDNNNSDDEDDNKISFH